jgi:uncharacterized protein (TIGR02246 family)
MTRRPSVSALLLGTLCLGSLPLVSGQAPQQNAPAAATAPAQATAPAPAREQAAAAPRAEERPIRDLVDAFAKAYSKPDLKALDALFTDQANVIDSAGETTRGKPDIMGMYASSFEENPALKLESRVEEVNFITPDVARVEGQSRLSTAKGEASEYTRFSGLAVNRNGNWLIAEIREYAAPAEDVSSYDRLSELEWMVGDWVDESDDVKSTSSVTWADNFSFLIRAYEIEVKGEKPTTGTMFVGWDPQTGQIKSWLFDSNGGHGEGLWTRTGEKEWVVKAHGVLRDGRPTSATQIHVVLNKDSVKTSSIDRIIGGQVAPDITDVVMVRKPPQPSAAPNEPATSPAAQPRSGASSN